MTSAAEIVRACFLAYKDKDRRVIEELLSKDFVFTSPLDNQINRQTYLDRCWPASKNVHDVKLVNLVESGSTSNVSTFRGIERSERSSRLFLSVIGLSC